jgi:hypothetical protein
MAGRHRQASNQRSRGFRWRSALLGLLIVAGLLSAVPAPAEAVSACTNNSTPLLGDLVTCSAVGNAKLNIPTGATRAVVSVAGGGGAKSGTNSGNGKLIQGTITWPSGTTALSVWTGSGGGTAG